MKHATTLSSGGREGVRGEEEGEGTRGEPRAKGNRVRVQLICASVFFSWQRDKGSLSVTVSGETTLSISALHPPRLSNPIPPKAKTTLSISLLFYLRCYPRPLILHLHFRHLADALIHSDLTSATAEQASSLRS